MKITIDTANLKKLNKKFLLVKGKWDPTEDIGVYDIVLDNNQELIAGTPQEYDNLLDIKEGECVCVVVPVMLREKIRPVDVSRQITEQDLK